MLNRGILTSAFLCLAVLTPGLASAQTATTDPYAGVLWIWGWILVAGGVLSGAVGLYVKSRT
jgi:hypothetical protein